MPICTFFGHRNSPNEIKPILKEVLSDLILNHQVTCFYVGNHGNFDRIVHSVLLELTEQYPNIQFFVVLSSIPDCQSPNCVMPDTMNTLIPDGIETVPKRFAVSWRNMWMIRHSDFTVTYIAHSWGGAAKFADWANKHGKTVINVCESPQG